jgi:hypothetical protein
MSSTAAVSKPTIRSTDMRVLDDLFEMHSGFVLDFSDRTFSQFFAEELDINIDDPRYAEQGGSKAKRLRCFLRVSDKATVTRTLEALWEYREAKRLRARTPEELPNARHQLLTVIGRLNGTPGRSQAAAIESTPDRPPYREYERMLQHLATLEPQARGYAFEAFLKQLFDSFGLKARDAFRLRGEQIDGSFILGSEIYLLEAKWQNSLSGVEHLHVFHGKIDQKAAWARGLFVSYAGFSEDGLQAFGRGKRVICMDGLDIAEALMRDIAISEVIEWKVRRAAETGLAFVRVRNLFP